MRTKAIRWDTLRHFSGVLDKHVDVVMDVLRSKGFQSSDRVRLGCNMHYVPTYDTQPSLDLPE
jgi:hypothetical protein